MYANACAIDQEPGLISAKCFCCELLSLCDDSIWVCQEVQTCQSAGWACHSALYWAFSLVKQRSDVPGTSVRSCWNAGCPMTCKAPSSVPSPRCSSQLICDRRCVAPWEGQWTIFRLLCDLGREKVTPICSIAAGQRQTGAQQTQLHICVVTYGGQRAQCVHTCRLEGCSPAVARCNRAAVRAAIGASSA